MICYLLFAICYLLFAICYLLFAIPFFIIPRSITASPIYKAVMTALQNHFEPKLRPDLHPANHFGGFGASGRLQFTPSEDSLLALGVYVLTLPSLLIYDELINISIILNIIINFTITPTSYTSFP